MRIDDLSVYNKAFGVCKKLLNILIVIERLDDKER